MAKKDWKEIQTKLQTVSPKLLQSFIDSSESFFPSETFKNPFLGTAENFSATQLNLSQANWIPLYKFSIPSKRFT